MSIELVVIDYTDPQQGTDLLALLSTYAKGPMGGGEDISEFAKANLLERLAKQSGAFSVIAYVDGTPAGLANCFEGFSTFNCAPLINIHDCAVMAEFRGLQLSQKLLAKVEQVGKERGCCKVTLEVLEGNAIAQNAYKKYGFAGYELDDENGHALFWQKYIK